MVRPKGTGRRRRRPRHPSPWHDPAMARTHPRRLPADVPGSERRVWETLRRLDDPWRVFHGVAWQSLRRGRPDDGEADFVLLHPDHGILVVEVKGGGLLVRDGEWFGRGSQGLRRIDPVEQAVSSKKALVRYLVGAIDGLERLDAGHAVWFPDVLVDTDLGPAIPDVLVLDRRDLGDAAAAIDRIVAHWRLETRLDESTVEAIGERLAPTVEIRHVLADDVAEIRARQVVLTEEQRRALDGLRRARRVIVYGGAGTGKTVLAVERARRLAADGFRVLLTCFNRPLGDALAGRFADVANVTAGNFHGLAHRWIVEAGLAFPDEPDTGFWEDRIGELALEALELLGRSFDAVLVDEGQDFLPSWFVVLEATLAHDDGPFLVFCDPHQAIYREGWEPPFAAVPYELGRNCRNTRQIAEVVARVFDDPEPTEAVEGLPVDFRAAEDDREIDRRVHEALRRLVVDERVRPGEIVVLTRARGTKDRLVGSKVAGLVLVDAERRGDGVVVETIHRFKGLEADAAIVVLDRLESDRDRALAYVGLSRARAHLVVVGPPEVGRRLGLR